MEQLLGHIDRIRLRLERREGSRRECEPRRFFSDWLLIKLWLLVAIKGWTFNIFFEKLACDGSALRDAWGLPTHLISRSQAYARLNQKGFWKRLREFLHECTREALLLADQAKLRVLAIDFTPLPVPQKDRKAAWGFSSKKGCLWGYKLGLVVTESGIILAFRLLRANHRECEVSVPLLQETIQRLAEVGLLGYTAYVTADNAFDAEKNFRLTARKMQAVMVCPGRKKWKKKVRHPRKRRYRDRLVYPYRTAGTAFARSPEGREIFKCRSAVERTNSQLKAAPFNILHVPRHIRGPRQMQCWCLGKMLYYLLGLIANFAEGRQTCQMKGYAA